MLAGPHPRSLSLGGCRASSFDKLRTTLSHAEGSLGPQALPETPSPRAPELPSPSGMPTLGHQLPSKPSNRCWQLYS
jgi:hypothetical protein